MLKIGLLSKTLKGYLNESAMQPLANTYLVLLMRVAMLLRDCGPLSRAGTKIVSALAYLNIRMHHILIHYLKEMYLLNISP